MRKGSSASELQEWRWTNKQHAAIERIAEWISDVDVRTEIISATAAHVRQRMEIRRQSAKNPSYWFSRTINCAFREEIDRRGIPRPNELTDQVHNKIAGLIHRRVPQEMKRAVIDLVFRRLRNEVAPIKDLEHWTNSVIRHALTDAIRERTGRSGAFNWQKTDHIHDTNTQIEKELAARNTSCTLGSSLGTNETLTSELDSNDAAALLLRLEVPSPRSLHDSKELLVSFLNAAVAYDSGKAYIRHLRTCDRCVHTLRVVNRQLGEFFDADEPIRPLDTTFLSLLDALQARSAAIEYLLGVVKPDLDTRIAGLRHHGSELRREYIGAIADSFLYRSGEKVRHSTLRRILRQCRGDRLEERFVLLQNIRVLGYRDRISKYHRPKKPAEKLTQIYFRVAGLLFLATHRLEFCAGGQPLTYTAPDASTRKAVMRSLYLLATGRGFITNAPARQQQIGNEIRHRFDQILTNAAKHPSTNPT